MPSDVVDLFDRNFPVGETSFSLQLFSTVLPDFFVKGVLPVEGRVVLNEFYVCRLILGQDMTENVLAFPGSQPNQWGI